MIETLTDYGNRGDWLAARANGIGASEVAILFGVAPAAWGSPYSLWLEKTGRLPRAEMQGEYLEIGQLIEPVVASLYEARTNRKLWNGGGPFCVAQHQRLPMFFATPDRWVVEAEGMPGVGNCQIKNAGWYMAHDWDDGIPDHVTVQVQSEIACMGVEWGSAAVLLGGNAFKKFDMLRSEALITEIEAEVEHFWELVQTNTAPPIDGSEATARALKRLHPRDTGEEVLLAEEAIGWLETWQDAKATIKAAEDAHEARKKQAENNLKAAIGSATFGRLPDGRRLTLKTTEREGYAVEPTSYRQLRIESTKTKGKGK